MNVISRAIAAEIDGVVALRQTFRILNGTSLPTLAAIHRNVKITCVTRPRRASGLERCSDDVVRILRIDGNGNFGGVDRVGVTNSDDLLRERRRRKKIGKDRNECQAAPASHCFWMRRSFKQAS